VIPIRGYDHGDVRWAESNVYARLAIIALYKLQHHSGEKTRNAVKWPYFGYFYEKRQFV